jgi:hypothetical protein
MSFARILAVTTVQSLAVYKTMTWTLTGKRCASWCVLVNTAQRCPVPRMHRSWLPSSTRRLQEDPARESRFPCIHMFGRGIRTRSMACTYQLGCKCRQAAGTRSSGGVWWLASTLDFNTCASSAVHCCTQSGYVIHSNGSLCHSDPPFIGWSSCTCLVGQLHNGLARLDAIKLLECCFILLYDAL